MSALETQVDGDHYKKLGIQPMEYSMANHLDACQHSVIKYVTRFRDKGGIRDLEKAKHVLDMLIEFEKRAVSGVSTVSEAYPAKDTQDSCGVAKHCEHIFTCGPDGSRRCVYCGETKV